MDKARMRNACNSVGFIYSLTDDLFPGNKSWAPLAAIITASNLWHISALKGIYPNTDYP